MTTTSSNIVETFVYIPFVEASEIPIDLVVQNTVVHNSNIVETFVYIPFVEASEMTIDLLVKKTFFTIFCGFRKVRFQRYRSQFKWNLAVLPHIQ